MSKRKSAADDLGCARCGGPVVTRRARGFPGGWGYYCPVCQWTWHPAYHKMPLITETPRPDNPAS